MHKIGLVISLVVAALGAFLMAVYVQRFEEERTGGAPVSILVAVKTIKRDTQLTDDALAVRDVPVAYVDSRAVRATDKTRIVGVRVVNSLQPGQVLTWTDVAAGNNDRRTLSSLVQPGFRAVSVRTRSDSTSYELIEPGIGSMSSRPSPRRRSSEVRSSCCKISWFSPWGRIPAARPPRFSPASNSSNAAANRS